MTLLLGASVSRWRITRKRDRSPPWGDPSADPHGAPALPIERKLEGREDAEAETIRGYCAAVRSALTDDGRPPLEASGLKLRGRLAAVAASLDRVGVRRGSRRN